MYIYKITVLPTNQCYVGFDTKPSYRLFRWNEHCRKVKNGELKYKLHQAMAQHGIENCSIEILEDGFTNIVSLALAEIEYIKKFDSKNNGLNSTYGGDGIGKHLHTMTEEDIEKIKRAIGAKLSEYNKNVKWANTTAEERKAMVKNSFTPEVIKRRAQTLKKYYEANPDAIDKKREQMRISRNTNKEYRDKLAREASIKGAEKVSKPIMVEFPDGKIVEYKSISAMQRETKMWAETLLRKTKDGEKHHGYKAWMR